jgi:hypothetical protein
MLVGLLALILVDSLTRIPPEGFCIPTAERDF